MSAAEYEPRVGSPSSEAGADHPEEATTRNASGGPAPDLAQSEGAETADTPKPDEKQGKLAASVPAGEPEAPVAPPGGERPPESDEAPESEDHEAKLQRDLEELAAKAEKADEYLELARRTQADFENYRKRAAREAAAAQERGVVKLAKELLPAVDNLDRALEAAQAANGADDKDTLVSGIKLVHADVIAALARAGIESFDPKGQPFDPQHHEAVAQQPVDGAQPGTIVEVYQRGYRVGESVLRPARVVVAG